MHLKLLSAKMAAILCRERWLGCWLFWEDLRLQAPRPHRSWGTKDSCIFFSRLQLLLLLWYQLNWHMAQLPCILLFTDIQTYRLVTLKRLGCRIWRWAAVYLRRWLGRRMGLWPWEYFFLHWTFWTTVRCFIGVVWVHRDVRGATIARPTLQCYRVIFVTLTMEFFLARMVRVYTVLSFFVFLFHNKK